MKPAAAIAVLLLIAISAAHLLRVLLRVDIVANGWHIPLWVSIVGFIGPALLAFLLWRENRK